MVNLLQLVQRVFHRPKAATIQKCRFCKKKLRTIRAIKRGYGPVCGKRNKDQLEREQAEAEGQLRLIDDGFGNARTDSGFPERHADGDSHGGVHSDRSDRTSDEGAGR